MISTHTAEPVRPAELDAVRPLRRTILFGLQHFLVMSATPISSVFLISAVLRLEQDITLQLLAASLVLSGIGSIVQSVGVGPFGSRLPFVMLPGGAPVILFIGIAQAHDARVATGAVVLTGLIMFLIVPVFTRLLRFFPPLVIGTMMTVVGINLVQVGAKLMFGQPGKPGYGDGSSVVLGLITIAIIVAAVLLGRGVIRRVAPMIGLAGGTVVAVLMGKTHSVDVFGSGLVRLPTLLPFGPPRFDLIAAIPLLLFSIASMAEATGQTVINSEAVGREPRLRVDAPRTIRGDALVSTAAGFFGMPLMVTSGENVGIVRMTGVRSRFVTVAAGVVLILVGLIAPIPRLLRAVPDAVVGGTSVVVFAVIIVLGVQMLARSALQDHATMFVVAVSLGLGLIPILLPAPYAALPDNLRILAESGVAVSTFSAVLLNAVLNHGPLARRRAADATTTED
ncbi:permease [Calidifontibacter sp. DB0510]|uniref:Permease n=1 Tax=Metallococcus carri TaxID=1656884 RepID=A0A967EA72_9MICO|nr:solute carrier family 23 protein [Metallococcus carri]NHN55579.1 permease [Metallococcus carri]NOP38237.1 purine/pyrimidine permease [Calidifontibacter sp. DB2511S]